MITPEILCLALGVGLAAFVILCIGLASALFRQRKANRHDRNELETMTGRLLKVYEMNQALQDENERLTARVAALEKGADE